MLLNSRTYVQFQGTCTHLVLLLYYISKGNFELLTLLDLSDSFGK